MKHKIRPKIGLLIPNLIGDYHRKQWNAVNCAAINADIHLVIFSPFMFYSHFPFRSDYFVTFQYISKENVDGLILSTGSLNVFYETGEILKLCRKLSPVPVVSIAKKLDGIPSVLTDNKHGMRGLIEHFIQVHEYDEIAFIKGPSHNEEAEERFSAYKEALAAHGIPFKKELVVEGDFSLNSGKMAVSELLDKRRIKFRALVAANDNMLLGAFPEIQARALRIPEDIALGGFDDIEIMENTDPPASTVTQPFAQKAGKATEMLIDLVNGRDVPAVVSLPTHPVIRESCGCRKKQREQKKIQHKKRYWMKEFPENMSSSKYTEIGSDVGYITIFSTYIMNALSIEKIQEQFEEVLSQLDIPSCYISFYKKGMPLLINKDSIPPNNLELILMYKNNRRIPVDTDKRIFNTFLLIPDRMFFKTGRRTLICSELVFQKEHYGIICFELIDIDPLVFHLLKLQLTNCLQYFYIHNKLDYAFKKLKGLDKAKTQFFVNISHELRTPLTLLLAPMESVISGEFGDSITNNRDLFRSMIENGTRLLQLIGNLLDVTKIESGKMKPKFQRINITKLIKLYLSSIHAGAKGKMIDVVFLNRSKKDIISCIDRELIEKAFFNLISNAFKFTPRGGKISIVLKRTKKNYSITVEDNGTGISSDNMDIIFDRFTQGDDSLTRKFKGTGIGLSFTKQIVELHSGEITVVSKKGEGASFTITLPFDNSKEDEQIVKNILKDTESLINFEINEDTGTEELKTAVSLSGKKSVLIIEDTGVMRRFIQKLLSDDYTVYTAGDGQEGYEKAKKHKPDIIVSDIMMPLVDGYTLTSMIKENPELRNIPIILLSAKTDIQNNDKKLKQEPDDYLLKPFKVRELKTRISHLLEKSSSSEKRLTISEIGTENVDVIKEILSKYAAHIKKKDAQKIALLLKNSINSSSNAVYSGKHISHVLKKILENFL